jgi:hypothetical protein
VTDSLNPNIRRLLRAFGRAVKGRNLRSYFVIRVRKCAFCRRTAFALSHRID